MEFRKYNKDIPLISLHIPKTGGTSFVSVLQTWFPNNLHLHYIKNKVLPNKVNAVKEDGCIHGHFNNNRGSGSYEYYPNYNQYVTVLRNPLKRQISYYNYTKFLISLNKLSANHPLAKYSNIDEFLENCNPNIFNFFPSIITKNNFEEKIPQHFVNIIILEDFQNSINKLAIRLDKPIVEIPHKNKVHKKEMPSKRSKQIFREKNRLEFRLYNFCKQNLNIV